MTTSPLHEEGMSLLTVVLVIGVPVLVLGVVRLAMAGERLVVVRGGRIARLPRHRVTAVLPVAEQVRRWPARSIAATVTARTRTADGADVRALVTLDLLPDPPVRGETYADPLARLEASAEQVLTGALADRVVGQLLDPVAGLAPALADLPLAGGRITGVDVEEVDVLLGPPGSA